MPIGKLFGINPAQGTQGPLKPNTNYTDINFAKNSFEFGNANPNRPEHRGDGIHGRNLYCLG